MCEFCTIQEFFVLFGVFGYGVLLGYVVVKDVQRILRDIKDTHDYSRLSESSDD